MSPLAESGGARGIDAADGAGINGSVSVPADLLEDGTDVEAGTATDALQNLLGLGIGEQRGAAVIDQHDVELLRAVGLNGRTRTANQGAVGGDGLAGAGGCEHGPQDGEIAHAGNDFLNAGDDDVNARNAGGEASIAFVGGDGNHAAVGNQEISAGDAHLGGEEGAPQSDARGSDETNRIGVLHVYAKFVAKEIGNLMAAEVHGRSDDVVRRLMAQLHDELAQVGLPDGHADFFERRGQMNFFGDHRLGFDDGLHVARLGQLDDVVIGLLGVLRPMNVTAAGDDLLLELGEILREIGDGIRLDSGTAGAGGFPVGEAQLAFGDRCIVAGDAAVNGRTVFEIRRLDEGFAKKLLGCCGTHGDYSLAPAVVRLADEPASTPAR